jgi:hypothetical protein
MTVLTETIEKRIEEIKQKGGFGEIRIIVHQDDVMIETTFKEKIVKK